MLEIGLSHYLTVGAILFTLGIFGIFLNYDTRSLKTLVLESPDDRIRFINIVQRPHPDTVKGPVSGLQAGNLRA